MISAFKDHFSERAASYAVYRPRYPQELADVLAGLVDARGTAWDAGCGSGQLSTLLAERFDRVVATDASAAQIAGAIAHPRVDYRAEPAEQPSLASGSIDLITVAQAAHWLNLPAFYMEARRVARPGAVIAFVAYERTTIEPAVDAVVEHFYSGVLEKWWPPERRHIETGYRHLAFPFAELPMPELEMKAQWGVDQLLGYIRTWSAVRAMEASDGPDRTVAFEAALRDAWGGSALRPVSWPIVTRVGTVFPAIA